MAHINQDSCQAPDALAVAYVLLISQSPAAGFTMLPNHDIDGLRGSAYTLACLLLCLLPSQRPAHRSARPRAAWTMGHGAFSCRRSAPVSSSAARVLAAVG